MRFLIVGSRYLSHLDNFYARHPNYARLSYRDAWQLLMDDGTDVGDSYSRHLRKLGHEAEEIILNDEILQKRWAEENGMGAYEGLAQRPGGTNPIARSSRLLLKSAGPLGQKFLDLIRRPFQRLAHPWTYEILAAQIEKARPDILLNHVMWALDKDFLDRVRPYLRLIVGQHASPLPPFVPYSSYDLILSSLPNLVRFFRSRGVKSEYLRLGFEPSLLDRLGTQPIVYPVSFVGGFSAHHSSGTKLLEEVASMVPVDFWGFGAEALDRSSSIRRRFHGEAWGMEMYRILARSKIALNRHIGVAENYANNMRLYEVTGVGTLLVTDMKDNLNDLFQVGKEVVAYHNPTECIQLVKYYLEHDDERRTIAAAGQQRTLRDHTYGNRMEELVEILGKYMP
jgi:spore maturation protein CgeB